MTESKLYTDVIEAIDKLFGDTSVSMEETLDSMEGIRDEAADRIAMIEADIAAREDS